MKLKDIISIIEKTAPVSYAYDWDNVGLMIGDVSAEVQSVMLTLDVTPAVVDEAARKGCQLIISHHPLFFDTIKNIDFSISFGKMIRKLVNENIAVYSCHTNMDAADGGINTRLAQLFELTDTEVLESHPKFSNIGIGRIGKCKSPCTVVELCERVKKILGTNFVKLTCANENTVVNTICVASGSCGDMIELAKSKGADVIITADVKYHQALSALELPIAVIDAGHYPTEFLVVDLLKELLSESELNIYVSEQKDCFQIK